MRMYFSNIPTYHFMTQALTECDWHDRLISFYLLKDHPDIALRHYVETGVSYREPKHRDRDWHKNRSTYVRQRKVALANRFLKYEREEKQSEKTKVKRLRLIE